MLEKKIIFVLIVGFAVMALLFFGILYFILQFRKTKLLHIEELLKTKLEIQDQTLNYIGRELHDNLGQLLTVSKIHVNSLMKLYGEDNKMSSLNHVLDKTIAELRALSKSLNSSRIKDFGFIKELSNEVDRIDKMQVIKISLQIEGIEKAIPVDKSIILYRIIQEFISNTLKYAEATELTIKIRFNDRNVDILIGDNGQGFDLQTASQGSGLTNIKNRAQLLHVEKIEFISAPLKGTQLRLTLPLN